MENDDGYTLVFNPDKYFRICKEWIDPEFAVWRRYEPEKLELTLSLTIRVYVICFESIELQLAEYLNNLLENYSSYLGALEVYEAAPVYWATYSQSLIPGYRMINKSLSIFDQTELGGDQNTGLQESLRNLGFRDVTFEDLHGRYTIFDEYEDFEQARRVAEWKRRSGNLLAFIGDDVVSRLADVAPDLSNKLWAVLAAFESAETADSMPR